MQAICYATHVTAISDSFNHLLPALLPPKPNLTEAQASGVNFRDVHAIAPVISPEPWSVSTLSVSSPPISVSSQHKLLCDPFYSNI